MNAYQYNPFKINNIIDEYNEVFEQRVFVFYTQKIFNRSAQIILIFLRPSSSNYTAVDY